MEVRDIFNVVHLKGVIRKTGWGNIKVDGKDMQAKKILLNAIADGEVERALRESLFFDVNVYLVAVNSDQKYQISAMFNTGEFVSVEGSIVLKKNGSETSICVVGNQISLLDPNTALKYFNKNHQYHNEDFDKKLAICNNKNNTNE